MIQPYPSHKELGLTDEEYEKIKQLLGRNPEFTELSMFSVMWSEHCGYKYSRPVLSRFAKYKEALEGEGFENAGVVDIGNGMGIVMKVESHNHPSAVEPVAGAATGVGGILRDIFTMGARPIASLNSLRFGPLTDPRNRYLFAHVVEGIGSYGNCVGVPTVGGEVGFHPSYTGNPLVNAMAVGIVDLKKVAKAAAVGVGNSIIYVGSATGRDGIHGATFASAALDEDSESRRPNVQIGDPFAEKLLIESTLEALETGAIVGIQDMGAAGLTCGVSEMASKAGLGMEIDISLVPRREVGMTPHEVMLSESQERMLCVVTKGREAEVLKVFHKWELNAVIIGTVTNDGRAKIFDGDYLAADIPAKFLTDECPTYHLEAEEPEYIPELRKLEIEMLLQPENMGEILLKLLASPNIASKKWVYEQYDSMVQAQTTMNPGAADSAVLKLHSLKQGIALSIDCNSRYCHLNPEAGGKIALCEAARNAACTGAHPKAATDCLNFGNPTKPHVFWQFKGCVKGIAQAAEYLETPVISGNVSFYNETEAGEVFPTPTIGVLGVLKDSSKRVSSAFTAEENMSVWLLQPEKIEDKFQGVGGSEYLSVLHGLESGDAPAINLDSEKRVQSCVIEAIENGIAKSAHDCSDGGLAVTLAECCIQGGVGAYVSDGQSMMFLEQKTKSGVPFSMPVPPGQKWSTRTDFALFGEVQSRIIITVKDGADSDKLEELAEKHGIEAVRIGKVSGENFTMYSDGKKVINISVTQLKATWENAIPEAMV